MKIRKGYMVTDRTDTNWYGDCPVWANRARTVGNKVTHIRVLGAGRWHCGCPGGHH